MDPQPPGLDLRPGKSFLGSGSYQTHLLSIVWKVIQSEIVSGLTNKANVTKTNVKESSMLEYLPISPSTQCARPPAKTIHPINYPSEFWGLYNHRNHPIFLFALIPSHFRSGRPLRQISVFRGTKWDHCGIPSTQCARSPAKTTNPIDYPREF